MSDFDPKKYEYIWSNYDTSFLVTHCRAVGVFRACDVLITHEPATREQKFFLAIADHKRIAEECALMYESAEKYAAWRQKFIAEGETCERLIAESKTHAEAISSMTTAEVADKFIERVRAFEIYLEDYWYHTNFFSVEKAEATIDTDPEKHKDMRARLDDMGNIKYEGRKILNVYINCSVFRPYLSELSQRLGRDDLESLTAEEIERLSRGEDVPRSNREKIVWVLGKFNNWELLTGSSAEDVLTSLEQTVFKTEGDAITGTPASKGTYRGKVRVLRIIMTGDEAGRLKNGEVLVANTTGPELMSACQRAGAIVTDEGGLTSHAAVVSRELKIPCIVGTKIGSKILKDGDMVEVDADKGIVRKI